MRWCVRCGSGCRLLVRCRLVSLMVWLEIIMCILWFILGLIGCGRCVVRLRVPVRCGTCR